MGKIFLILDLRFCLVLENNKDPNQQQWLWGRIVKPTEEALEGEANMESGSDEEEFFDANEDFSRSFSR